MIFSLTVYQTVFSPDHGSFSRLFGYTACRFYPSCSEYAKDAFSQYGLFRGLMLSLGRIFRCNPFQVGGYDPVK